MNKIEEKIIKIVSDHLELPDVKLEDSFGYDLPADSLDQVEIVMKTEKEFNLTIPDDIYAKIYTVGSLCKAVEAILENREDGRLA